MKSTPEVSLTNRDLLLVRPGDFSARSLTKLDICIRSRSFAQHTPIIPFTMGLAYNLILPHDENKKEDYPKTNESPFSV